MTTTFFTPLTLERRVAIVSVFGMTRRWYALVDASDGERATEHAWFRHGRTGYPTCRLRNGLLLTLHRHLVSCPQDGLVIDHINGDKLDNRRKNLRSLTVSQNGLNRHRSNRNNQSSSTPGVSWCKANGKWRVQIRRDGKDHFGGYFDDETSAQMAARSLRSRLLTD